MIDARKPIAPQAQCQCPRCFGRGYKPESRKPSRRNPGGLGFYARTCPRCNGAGIITTIR